jgi:hypothetical protein
MRSQNIWEPPREVLIQELISWGIEHQAYLNPHVEIYEDPRTGMSFRAAKELPPQSNIVTCPYQVSLSYLNAIEAPEFCRHSVPFPRNFLDTLSKDDPNIIGHFFLMQQYMLREKSFWWAYIRLLPQPYQPEKYVILGPSDSNSKILPVGVMSKCLVDCDRMDAMLTPQYDIGSGSRFGGLSKTRNF